MLIHSESKHMGLTVLEIGVANPAAPDTVENVEFLIDSGAIYSVVPAAILDKLQIKPLVEQQFRIAAVRQLGGRQI